MADVVDRATRSWIMSGIKGKNTLPELRVRSFLHKARLRFRLHDRRLPGKLDLVLKKYSTVVFVHGCFWHQHAKLGLDGQFFDVKVLPVINPKCLQT